MCRKGPRTTVATLTFVTNPPHERPDLAIRRVLAVARLGEVGMRGWWRSHGLSQAGMYVLEGSFPRTANAVALELDLLSAQRRHDAVLGRTSALHLFSDHLPFYRRATAWLSETKTGAVDHAPLDELAGLSLGGLLKELRALTASATTAGDAVGQGIRLDELTSDQLENEEALSQAQILLAASYVDQDGQLRPPYFDLV